jgi:hypothetical protein
MKSDTPDSYYYGDNPISLDSSEDIFSETDKHFVSNPIETQNQDELNLEIPEILPNESSS